MTKIVCISDTHNQHITLPELPEGNILIHSGDFSIRGQLPETISFLHWLEAQTEKFDWIVLVAGNHDFICQENTGLFYTLLQEIAPSVIYLEDSYTVIEGLKVYGSPWTKQFYNWAFMKEDQELVEIWNVIPNDIDILITHGPPYSILDKNKEGELCGSRALYSKVKVLQKLKLHVFGHIHESHGRELIGDTTFINASVLNRSYNIAFEPQVIEL